MQNTHNNIQKTSSIINMVTIVTGIVFLSLIYILRLDLLPILSIFDYIKLLSFISVLIILPDYISSRIKRPLQWYCSIEFNTILIIALTGIIGLFFSGYRPYASYIIIPASVLLVIWEFSRFYKHKHFLPVAFGFVSVSFFILIFYSQGWHSPLFPEHVILGTGFIDILFHSSLSNMFSTLGYASTGLDGAPYINYHWGAHGLFAGLQTWIGFNTITFYNIAYPLIFIPLFFKALLLCTHRLFQFRNYNYFDIILAFSVIAFIYSLGIPGFTEARAMPMNSESFGISIVLTFLYFSLILIFISANKTLNFGFAFFSALIILLLFLLKISTGFVVFAGISFLLIRLRKNIWSLAYLVISFIIIGILVYEYIYPVFRNETSVSPGNRLFNYWEWSAGFLTYFLGILILLITLIYNTASINYSKIVLELKSRKHIDLEVLAIINIVGAAGALWVTSNSGDVYYFFAVQIFISLTYLFFYSHKIFYSLNLNKNSKNILLATLIILSIIALPDIIPGIIRSNTPNKYFRELSNDQKTLKELMIELMAIDESINKKDVCIYIPRSEKWYYSSDSSFKEIFIAPAVSGIATINSIPNWLIKSDFNYFSIAYYRNNSDPQINNMENAILKATELGYNEMIVFVQEETRLKKQMIRLNGE